MQRILIPAAAFLAFLLVSVGCSSDSNPSQPSGDPPFDTTLTAAAITDDGAGRRQITFDFSTIETSLVDGSALTQFRIQGRVGSGKVVAGTTEENVTLNIQFPDTIAAEYSWEDLVDSYSGDIAMLTIGGEEYYPAMGLTRVLTYDADRIRGHFSGQMINPNSGIELEIVGHFVGKRPAPIVDDGPKPTDYELFVVLNGGDFSGDTIALSDAPAMSRIMSGSGGQYLSTILLGGDTVVPGVGSVNIGGTFDFPQIYPGTWPWGLVDHCDFTLNINGEIFIGTDGRTIVKRLGQAFFTEVSGYFDGYFRSTDTGKVIEVKYGWFRSIRFN